MEEIKKILNVSIFRNSDDNEVVRINEESRVIVVIDNEDNFKDVFSKDGEVDLFKQLLSQEVQRYYSQDKVFRKKLCRIWYGFAMSCTLKCSDTD